MEFDTDHLSADDNGNGDGEGVWSPDIEKAFQEAYEMFPPCGRRKHILPEEGGSKMYGRNELIARHIEMKTGKKRTRKQVSSHIQVLARRKAKTEVASVNNSSTTSSPASLMSPSLPLATPMSVKRHDSTVHQAGAYYDLWTDRPIVTQKIRLAEFSAFIEFRNQNAAINSTMGGYLSNPTPGFTRHSYVKIDYTQTHRQQYTNRLERIDISQIQDKFPEIDKPDGLLRRAPRDTFYLVKFWADLNNNYECNMDDQNSYFGFSSKFETIDPHQSITCSTIACSYGKPAIEKVDKIYGKFNGATGRYSFDINRSPMCEFMIQFIRKLRQLPNETQMNIVLENFSVLQVITGESPSDVLLCLVYVFEIAPRGSGIQCVEPQYHVYKLVQD